MNDGRLTRKGSSSSLANTSRFSPRMEEATGMDVKAMIAQKSFIVKILKWRQEMAEAKGDWKILPYDWKILPYAHATSQRLIKKYLGVHKSIAYHILEFTPGSVIFQSYIINIFNFNCFNFF